MGNRQRGKSRGTWCSVAGVLSQITTKPHTAAPSLPMSAPRGIGERVGTVKVRKTVFTSTHGLTGKHASKARQGTHSPLPTGRQVFRPSQEIRAPSLLIVNREENVIASFTFVFLQLYILKKMPYGM